MSRSFIWHKYGKAFIRLAIGFFVTLSAFSQANGAIEQRSYSLSTTELREFEVAPYLLASGPVLAILSESKQEIYDARSGARLQREIQTNEIIRPLGFVISTDQSKVLDLLGCRNVNPGCTSPDDADLIIKVMWDAGRSELRAVYFDLAPLREKLISALSGEENRHFDDLEKLIINELVRSYPNVGPWRHAAIDAVFSSTSLQAATISHRNLRQFNFSNDPSFYPKRRVGDVWIEETVSDRSEQHICRILGSSVVDGYENNRNDKQWLHSAMQKSLNELCKQYSTHFRHGLFDASTRARSGFAKGLKSLACAEESIDYWCIANALDGKLCEDITFRCEVSTPKAKPDVAPPVSSSSAIRNQDNGGLESVRVRAEKNPLRLFQVSETLKNLVRDDAELGLSFLARPPQQAQDGKFEITIAPSSDGMSLMKLNAYDVTLRVLLQVSRKDRCTFLCPFRAAEKEYPRTEQRLLTFRVNPPYFRAKQAIDFGGLLPLNGKHGFQSSLSQVRLMVDQVTRITSVPMN